MPQNPTPSQGLYGRFRSLYGNFDDATVSKLEEAILLGHVRAFESSLAIFESFTLSSKHSAIVAIEHSLVLWNDMRYSDAAEVLRGAISFADTNEQHARARDVRTLIRLLLANADIITEGNLTRARECLIESRSWLQNVAIEEMDDVQVCDLNSGGTLHVRLTHHIDILH